MAAGTLTTPVDLITLALKTAGVIGVGQTPDYTDTNDCFIILNTILAEWQVQRWLVYPLADFAVAATGAVSYTVGPGGQINTSTAQRPDKIDAVYARQAAQDAYLWPFMSREGYDRIVNKNTAGTPEAFFYDPQYSMGVLYLYPVPDNTYTIHINCKSSLGQFTSLTERFALPLQYINALQWNLCANIRPLYQLPPDPQIAMRAEQSLQAIINSIAQVPQQVQAASTNRQGIYSIMPMVSSQPQGTNQ